ncbi:odorant receptor 13 isoform X1 [Nasonia vitripennis]|uniref:Odorant receptor n=1 Tax=Nasonia vitripennis TaxID=7425 RepID=A0A7M7QX54_NASVI|nr:odorant receptor 13 isoform X1 [Nasonia vitripennis]
MTVEIAEDSMERIVALSDDQNVDGYNHAIGPCRFFLRLLGTWPDPYGNVDSWTTSARCLVITATMFLFATISQTVKMALSYKDLNLVTEILTNCNIPTTIATIKIASIWYYRWVLRDLVRQIIEDWEMSHDRHESAIMWRSAKISRIFSIGCMFMTEGTLLTQCVVGLFRPISYAFKTDLNQSIEWPLYMKGSFPYDVQSSPNYELSILGQLLSNVFASTSFSSADSFFIVLMFHLIGQLSILKLTILDLPSKIENSDDRSKFIDRFAFVHMRHNRLWRFSMAIEESFNTMFLIQMIPCIFALCTQGYQLIMIMDADNVSLMELIFMIYFLVLFLFTIFTYCYVTEILRCKSLELSYAVYDCDWTILPAKEARILLLILVRTQHPFEITAGKFASFSLPFYCRVGAFSYFSKFSYKVKYFKLILPF